MARERGTFNFSASLEVKKQAPLDARQTYITYEELTQQTTWVDADSKVWLFKGLIVPVSYNGQNALFMLINPDNYTSTSSWVRVDGAGAKSPIYSINNINTLTTSSSKEDVVAVLGEYNDFKAAFESNKLIQVLNENYNVAASIEHLGEFEVSGTFIIRFRSNNQGNPVIAEYVFNHDGTDWYPTQTVSSVTLKKLALATDLDDLNNIYFLGDILTLTNESVSTIATVLTPHADFKQAVKNKKIFVAKTSLGQFYVNVSAITEESTYLVTSIVNANDGNLYLLGFRADANGNNWDSIANFAKHKLATDQDLNKKVSSISAAPNKGIEIGGTRQSPTVGIKLDSTQGNVTLSLGENGLKANDATALRDVTGQNFIKKNGTNVEGHLNLTYNNATKKINLEGFDSSVIASIDATAFIKDGMIDTVELVTDPESHDPGTYLVITFNTDAGKEAIYLNVTSLIDVYQGTNGVIVSGKNISLKIDTSSERYISLGPSGIKISGIDDKINEVVEQAIIEALAWHEA